MRQTFPFQQKFLNFVIQFICDVFVKCNNKNEGMRIKQSANSKWDFTPNASSQFIKGLLWLCIRVSSRKGGAIMRTCSIHVGCRGAYLSCCGVVGARRGGAIMHPIWGVGGVNLLYVVELCGRREGGVLSFMIYLKEGEDRRICFSRVTSFEKVFLLIFC